MMENISVWNQSSQTKYTKFSINAIYHYNLTDRHYLYKIMFLFSCKVRRSICLGEGHHMYTYTTHRISVVYTLEFFFLRNLKVLKNWMFYIIFHVFVAGWEEWRKKKCEFRPLEEFNIYTHNQFLFLYICYGLFDFHLYVMGCIRVFNIQYKFG